MLNRKGFLLIESVFMFEIVLLIISLLSLLVFSIHRYHTHEASKNYMNEESYIKEIYTSTKGKEDKHE